MYFHSYNEWNVVQISILMSSTAADEAALYSKYRCELALRASKIP